MKDDRQEAISVLEDLHGQLCFQRHKLDERIRTLKSCIEELQGKKGKIDQERN